MMWPIDTSTVKWYFRGETLKGKELIKNTLLTPEVIFVEEDDSKHLKLLFIRPPEDYSKSLGLCEVCYLQVFDAKKKLLEEWEFVGLRLEAVQHPVYLVQFDDMTMVGGSSLSKAFMLRVDNYWLDYTKP
jgi:hypothetical protein